MSFFTHQAPLVEKTSQQKLTEYRTQIQDGEGSSDGKGEGDPRPYLESPLACSLQVGKLKFRVPDGMTPKELRTVMLTAQFVAWYGKHFWVYLTKQVIEKREFEFMKSTDSRHFLFTCLIVAYKKVLMPPDDLANRVRENDAYRSTILGGFLHFSKQARHEEVEIALIDWVASMHGLEYPPPLESHSFRIPDGMTTKELHTFMLTAQFVAWFGNHFWVCMTQRLINNPEFEFLKLTDSSYFFFTRLIIAYKKVVVPPGDLEYTVRESDDFTETILKGFLQFAKQERCEQWEMALIDWVASMGRFQYQFLPPHFSLTNQPPQMPLGYLFSELLTQPPPVVPEDMLIDQHPGSFTIRVSVPNVIENTLINFAVQSLSERVASLKEKIALDIHIPANKLKLRGKAGVLSDNMSLDNVGAGEVLTLSF